MKKISVLFIGNSYTYYNNLWDLFKMVADIQGDVVEVSHVTNGGWTLQQMGDINDEFGKIVDKRLKEEKFDIVILQEQSTRPVIDKDIFFDSVTNLVNKINQNGAKVYLYETWGRKKGNIVLEQLKLTNKSMTEKLVESYSEIANKLNIKVCHVGTAFYNINNNFDIELYDEDKTHPSYIGSLLAALVIYKTIFNKKINFNNIILDDTNTKEILENEINKEMCYYE